MAIRDRVERGRPWVVVFGLLLLVLAFVLAASAVRADHHLRVTRAWNGVTGSARGVAAHARNVSLARTALDLGELVTAVLGVALAVPRRAERTGFRWMGWLAFVLAGLLAFVAALGLVGLSLHSAISSFDPGCPLDGPCTRPPRALSPEDWRLSYFGLLALAAVVVTGILTTCVGIRWIAWGICALVRRGRAENR